MKSARPILLALVAASCSVVPPHAFPPFEEREVVATHYVSNLRTVRVPASRPDLTVLWLRTDPEEVREFFVGGERHMHAAGHELTVHCRYRVYGDDPAALPPPEQLFPDAASIRTVWQRQQ